MRTNGRIMSAWNRRDAIRSLALGATAAWGAGAARAADDAPPAAKEETWPAVDVLVCGGGPAGVAAALMAARAGRKTLLVARYGRLGGMAVQAMVGPLMGSVRSARVDEILAALGGRNVDYEGIDLVYADLLEKAGARILLHAWAAEPLLEGGRVAGARLVTKQGPIAVPARVTIDATGDADLAAGAGAAFDQGCGKGANWEADGLVQPVTIMFRVAGVKHKETMEANRGRKAFRFPDGRTWNQVTKEANAKGDLPPTVGMVRTYLSRRPDERVINATQVNGIDGTKVADLTRAELEGRRQVQPILEFLQIGRASCRERV